MMNGFVFSGNYESIDINDTLKTIADHLNDKDLYNITIRYVMKAEKVNKKEAQQIINNNIFDVDEKVLRFINNNITYERKHEDGSWERLDTSNGGHLITEYNALLNVRTKIDLKCPFGRTYELNDI